MHPLSFKSLSSRLVTVEIVPPSLRSRKGNYVLPPVLIQSLLLVLIKGTLFYCSASSRTCPVLMRLPSFSLIIINSLSLPRLRDVSRPESIFSSFSIKVSSFPEITLIYSLFDFPSYSGSRIPVKLKCSLRALGFKLEKYFTEL